MGTIGGRAGPQAQRPQILEIRQVRGVVHPQPAQTAHQEAALDPVDLERAELAGQAPGAVGLDLVGEPAADQAVEDPLAPMPRGRRQDREDHLAPIVFSAVVKM